jgi:hypothetical protein
MLENTMRVPLVIVREGKDDLPMGVHGPSDDEAGVQYSRHHTVLCAMPLAYDTQEYTMQLEEEEKDNT